MCMFNTALAPAHHKGPVRTNLLEEHGVGRVWCIEVVGQRVHRTVWGAATSSSALKVGQGQSGDLCVPQDGLVAVCVVVGLHFCRTPTRRPSGAALAKHRSVACLQKTGMQIPSRYQHKAPT